MRQISSSSTVNRSDSKMSNASNVSYTSNMSQSQGSSIISGGSTTRVYNATIIRKN